MNLCNQCISQVEDGKKFCADCGQPLLTDSAVYSATASGDINSYPMERTPIGDINTYTIQDSPAGNFRTKYRLKATPLIIALSSAIVVFLLAALYFTGAALNSKEKQVAKITAAIESGNSDKLADFIICSDSKLKIDGKSL
ncbi:MAG: hypothetical protein Q8930_09840, partial [Bacillota bacterium]|nr:hypothetical protein [Bacillota bacterium]